MSANTDDSPSVMRFIGGVFFGVVMTLGYVRYAWTMPDVAQLPGKITEAAVVTTAEIDLYDPRAAPEVRRRALAVVMSQNPELFVEIDHELGGRLMEETLRREALRETKLLKHQMSAYDIAIDKPALREALERKHGSTSDDEELKRRMLLSALRDEDFSCWYIRTRFPLLQPSDWVDLVLNVYENELRSSPTAERTEVAVESDPSLH